MDDIVHQREHFESISKIYQESRNDAKHLFLKKHMWDVFLKDIPFPSSEKLNVLEAMCVAADFYGILRERLGDDSFSFDAFDYPENMVTFAQKENPGIKVWNQDVTTFCAPESYDIICIIGGLHHVHWHTDMVLHNISCSLRTGGLFINSEPTHNNPLFSIIRQSIYRKNSFFDNETERGFATAELNTSAQSHGLRLVHQLYHGLLAYCLWYNPGAFPLLNIGSQQFVEKYILLEAKLWGSKLARFFSFATLSCYRKEA